MTEISEVRGVTEDIEARPPRMARAIVISNGIDSDVEQSHGLLRALKIPCEGILHVQGPNRLWFIRWLPSFLYDKFPNLSWFGRSNSLPVSTQQAGPSGIRNFTHVGEVVDLAREEFANWGPLLVIGSGRDTASAASLIKKSAPTHVFVVQIQYPACDYKIKMFDFVILPEHEYYLHSWFPRRWAKKPGNNVFLTIGVMHTVDTVALSEAASRVNNNQLGTLNPLLLMVNLGGPTKNCPYNEDVIRQFSRDLLRVYHSCGSIRIYISSTTPHKFFEILDQDFKDDVKLKIWTEPDPDQYKAYLYYAHAIVVTADSVSMLSHACNTGKPVYVVGDERCTSSWLKGFLKKLMDHGAVKKFSQCQNISDAFNYRPVSDALHAATAMYRVYNQRRWRM